MFPVPRRSRPPRLLASLIAPLLLAGVAAPVIAQMARPPARSLPAAPAGGPSVRVLLAQASGWDLPPQAFTLRLLDGRQRLLRLLAPGETLRLSASSGGGVAEIVTPSGETRRLGIDPAGLWLEPVAVAGEQPLFAFGQERYRGLLQIRPADGGRLMAINHLPLEAYLASVVGSEMPASWPQPALRAQAVAARTYALSQLKPASAYDLKSTVASQAYRGLAAETDSTRAAVTATRGEVLMQNGRLIQAVFHSSSGGSTEDSGQVWSRQLPYLVSVPDFDDGSPVSRWTVRLEPDQLSRLFRETGGVRRIDVLSSSGTGRVRRARVIGPAGSLDLSGTELRQRLGLRSTLVTFALQPVDPAAPAGVIDRAVRGASPLPDPAPSRNLQASVPASQPTPPAGAAAAPLVDSATGMVMDGPPSSSLPGGSPAAPAPRPLFSGAASGTEPRLALLVEGRGFGHGVGMSQWGAYAMAQQGRSYDQILLHYYRGVDLLPYPSP